MTPTEAAAAAEAFSLEDLALIVATLTGVISLLWQVFRYFKEGPKLRVRVAQHLTLSVGGVPVRSDKMVAVFISNNGTQATTLVGLVMVRYEGKFDRLLRRKMHSHIRFTHFEDGVIPHKLQAGDVWRGMVYQEDVDEYFERGGTFYIGLLHSYNEKPALTRIQPEPEADNKLGEDLSKGS